MKSAIALVASAAFVSAAVAGAIPVNDLETRAETNHDTGTASRDPNKPYKPIPIVYASATADLLQSLQNAVEDCDESAPAPIKEEPTPAPIKEEPTPEPSKEEHTSAPIKEEPTPAPIKEEPTPEPIKEEPTPEPSKEEHTSAPSKEEPTHESSQEKPNHPPPQHAPQSTQHNESMQQDEAPLHMDSSPSQSDTPESLIKPFVDNHNKCRAGKYFKPVTWDDSLSHYAAKVAKTCIYNHVMNLGPDDYGQNIASYFASPDLGSAEHAAVKAMTDWCDEGKSFNFKFENGNPVASGVIGHYTQMVWEGTEKIGCATHRCTGQYGTWTAPTMYTVCNYFPRGNVEGKFDINVKRPN